MGYIGFYLPTIAHKAYKWGMPKLTAVSFPPKLTPALREALEYYDFENFNQFFRTCSYVLIQHHKRGDILTVPFAFKSHKDIHP